MQGKANSNLLIPYKISKAASTFRRFILCLVYYGAVTGFLGGVLITVGLRAIAGQWRTG